MGKIIRKNWKMKLLLCAAVTAFSMLFIGAGQVTGQLSGRKDMRKVENRRWEMILSEMENEIPLKYRKEWKRIAEKNPELLINTVSITKR